jgi:CRP/FNR family transcriptional regulator, cyclic AMP receptor protein
MQLEVETDRSLVEDARRLLGECGLFSGLEPDERKALFARVRIRIRNFSASETIFLKGSPGDHMMAVLDGNVRISVASADGQALVLGILGPGELFGEIALLDGKDRTADASAATDCSLAILDRSEILSFWSATPARGPISPRCCAIDCAR